MSRPRSRGATAERKVRSASSTPPFENAGGSWVPVLAPLAAAARPKAFPARTSTSTVGLPRLSRIFRIVAPSIEGIAEPLNVQGRGPGGELGERDLEGVARRIRGHQRGRSHRNLQGSSADDAGSLEASVPHENTGSAHKSNGYKGFRGPFRARFEGVARLHPGRPRSDAELVPNDHEIDYDDQWEHQAEPAERSDRDENRDHIHDDRDPPRSEEHTPEPNRDGDSDDSEHNQQRTDDSEERSQDTISRRVETDQGRRGHEHEPTGDFGKPG